jgi:glycine betaine/proline transport system ATP-binding protein
MIRDVPVVSPETLLGEMFEVVSTSRVPVAVTSESGKLLGVVIRGAVLGALAGNHDGLRKAVADNGA